MAEQRKQARIIHLEKDEYKNLINKGSTTVDGKVIEYRANDVHVTPSIIDESNIVLRNMTSEDGSFSVEYNEDGVKMNGRGNSTEYTSVGIFVDTASGENKLLSFPSKSGTLATTDDCKKLYSHYILLGNSDYSKTLGFHIISSKGTRYASPNELRLNSGSMLGTIAVYQDNAGTRKYVYIYGLSEGSISINSTYVSFFGISDNSDTFVDFTTVLTDIIKEL